MTPYRLLGVLLLTLALSACAGPPFPDVPAPIAEAIPKPPPSPDVLIWRPGYWNWTGGSYAWTPGEYVPDTGQGRLWMPGHWSRGSNGWTWNPPGWVR